MFTAWDTLESKRTHARVYVNVGVGIQRDKAFCRSQIRKHPWSASTFAFIRRWIDYVTKRMGSGNSSRESHHTRLLSLKLLKSLDERTILYHTIAVR